MNAARRVVVVGGGVAGLTTAYRLTRTGAGGPVVTVFEAGPRLGGKLATTEIGGLTLEAGADSFVARKPWARELCRELGLERDLIAPGESGAWLWTEHGLERVLKDAAFGIPGDVGDVLRWPGLSRAGRLRAAKDLVLRRRRDGDDESLGSLLRRRLGNEATDRAVAPLLAGLFAGDVDRLSVRATFPELERWESYQGSLIRGAQAARRGARRADAGPMFLKPRRGVTALTDRLADRIEEGAGTVRTGSPVTAIERTADGFALGLERGPGVVADAVVLALPAFTAAELLADLAPDSSGELGSIPYASTGIVVLVYAEGSRAALPGGTGFVVPRGSAPMTACTWISAKWPDERFGTRAVVRCYVGSAGDDDVVDAPDADLVDACERHLAALIELPARAQHRGVVRWRRAMPQYEVGHLERVARIRSHLPAGIFVAGSAVDGVGIADCVRSADETARTIVERLADVKETV